MTTPDATTHCHTFKCDSAAIGSHGTDQTRDDDGHRSGCGEHRRTDRSSAPRGTGRTARRVAGGGLAGAALFERLRGEDEAE